MSSLVPRRRKASRLQTTLLFTLAFTAAPAMARGISQPFEVRVDLWPAERSAICSEVTIPGATSQVTVACAPSQPTQSPLRIPTHVLLHVFRAEDLIGTVDGMMTTGTVTSWRVVRLAHREYLEMTVGW